MSRETETLAWLNSPAVRWYTDEERTPSAPQSRAEAREAEKRFPYPPDEMSPVPGFLSDRCMSARAAAVRRQREAFHFKPLARAPGELDAIKTRLARKGYPVTDPTAGLYDEGPWEAQRLPCRCGVRMNHRQWLAHSCGDAP